MAIIYMSLEIVRKQLILSVSVKAYGNHIITHVGKIWSSHGSVLPLGKIGKVDVGSRMLRYRGHDTLDVAE